MALGPALRDAWWDGLCGRSILLPPTGAVPSQRPRPTDKLQLWLCVALRALSFQIVWAAVFFGLSFRRAPVGLFLNPLYIVAAALGIHGSLHLTWQLVGLALAALLFLVLVFTFFVVSNYLSDAESPQAWVVLALFLPGLGVDCVIVAACVPFVLEIRAADHRDEADERAEAAAAAAEPAVPAVQRSASDEAALGAVSEFRCPITLCVMRDPVIASDGHSYERAAIENWLEQHKTSPVTGARLDDTRITRNHPLRSLIESARGAAVGVHLPGGAGGEVTVTFVGEG